MAEVSSELDVLGPTPGVKYPIKVSYCGNCSMPFEYCEYYPDQEGCNKWLEKNLPEKFAALGLKSSADDKDGEGEDDAKKRQKRGGKGMVKAKKKEAEVEKHIILSIAPRGKKKSVTVVQGLKTCGIDLKVYPKAIEEQF